MKPTVPQVILATVDAVPVLDHVNRGLLGLPEGLSRRVLVAHPDALDARVTKALAGVTLARPLDEDDDPSDAERDLRALASAWTVLLEGAPFASDEAHPTVIVRVAASTELADLRARLEKAKLRVLDAAEFERPSRLSEDEALAHAIAPFAEHFPAQRAAVEDYLRGRGPAPVEALRGAGDGYYTAPADFLSDALTGAVERWNEPVAGRLLALWAALLDPAKGLDVALGLGEEGLPPELGYDRARAFYVAARASGVALVHAAVAARRVEGASSWFFAPTLLATPEVFEEAARVDLAAARRLAAQAVPKMWLDHAPTAKAKLAALVARGSAALGAEALVEVLGALPDAVEERHLPADDELAKTARLAAMLDARFPGTLARATEGWAQSASPNDFVTRAAQLLSRDPEHVDRAVVWNRLLECIEAAPADPFPGDAFSGPTVLEALPKPDARLKERLAQIVAQHGDALGLYYRKRFAKLIGKKPAPPVARKRGHDA